MCDLSNIGINCKAKLHEKETRTDTVLIKIIDTNYSNSKKKVVIGTGLATSVPAILNSHSKKKKCILGVLLDSGSDGDLVFVQEGMKLLKKETHHRNGVLQMGPLQLLR